MSGEARGQQTPSFIPRKGPGTTLHEVSTFYGVDSTHFVLILIADDLFMLVDNGNSVSLEMLCLFSLLDLPSLQSSPR